MQVEVYAALNYVLGFLPSSAEPRGAALARRRVRVETDRGRTYFAVVDASTKSYLAFRGFDAATPDALAGPPSSFLFVDLDDGGVGLRNQDGAEERVRVVQGEELHGRAHVNVRHLRVECAVVHAVPGAGGRPAQPRPRHRDP